MTTLRPRYKYNAMVCCRFVGGVPAVVDGDELYDVWCCDREITLVGERGAVCNATISGDKIINHINGHDVSAKDDPFFDKAYELVMRLK